WTSWSGSCPSSPTHVDHLDRARAGSREASRSAAHVGPTRQF
ncbi:MAG: hypothetical protein AVDCRST_MAG32-987, partial [uncultured Nocardioides sp.]